MATQIFLTTTGTHNWTVPSDWNSSNNTVEVIGAGGNGYSGNGGGGGGGGYGKKSNISLTPNSSVSYTIATGGSSGDSYFNGASLSAAPVGAGAGANATTSPGAGGIGKGDTTYTGGTGGGAGGTYGGGGGGAAGPNGNGNNGVSGSSTGSGGSGDNGSGGAGGSGGANPANPGGNGTEYSSSPAYGSGGGGGNGVSGADGGAGGTYGGGGGSTSTGHNGGVGKQGLIIITYTSSAPLYWVGGSATWDSSSQSNQQYWSLSSGGTANQGLPNSTTTAVYFDANSGSGTVVLGHDFSGITVDMTGFTGTFTQTNAFTLSGNLLTGGSYTNNGGVTVTGNMSVIASSTYAGTGACTIGDLLLIGTGATWSNTGTVTMNSTSGGNTITPNNVAMTSPIVFNGSGGSWALQNDLTCKSVTITAGTLIATNQTITLTGTGTVWSNSGTFTYGTSTIKITDASSSSKTFAGNGKTYYNLYFTGAGTGTFIISGSNTFNQLKCDTPPHTIQFTAGTTQTLADWQISGTAGNLMTCQSTTNGSNWYIVKSPAGTVSADYLSLQDSHVS